MESITDENASLQQIHSITVSEWTCVQMRCNVFPNNIIDSISVDVQSFKYLNKQAKNP